jgi:Na+-transporting NADH:ubiquinone oxidoreductase subunit NqrD
MTGQASTSSFASVFYRILAVIAGLLGFGKLVGLVLFETPYGRDSVWFVKQCVYSGVFILGAIWFWVRSNQPKKPPNGAS